MLYNTVAVYANLTHMYTCTCMFIVCRECFRIFILQFFMWGFSPWQTMSQKGLVASLPVWRSWIPLPYLRTWKSLFLLWMAQLKVYKITTYYVILCTFDQYVYLLLHFNDVCMHFVYCTQRWEYTQVIELHVNSTAIQDYVSQRTEFTFPRGTRTGDSQCLGIPIVDNDVPDLMRSFSVEMASVNPLVRVQPGRERKIVGIVDNDRKFSTHHFSHFSATWSSVMPPSLILTQLHKWGSWTQHTVHQKGTLSWMCAPNWLEGHWVQVARFRYSVRVAVLWVSSTCNWCTNHTQVINDWNLCLVSKDKLFDCRTIW